MKNNFRFLKNMLLNTGKSQSTKIGLLKYIDNEVFGIIIEASSRIMLEHGKKEQSKVSYGKIEKESKIFKKKFYVSKIVTNYLKNPSAAL